MTVIEKRLASRLVQDGDCLVYTGARSGGYGTMRVHGRMTKAHRLAWEAEVGPIPPGLCVLHHCDNRPCCNVAHLFLGTVADNNADRAGKGRSGGVFREGKEHPRYRVTPEIRSQIAALRQRGLTQQRIAHEVGISRGHVAHVLAGRGAK